MSAEPYCQKANSGPVVPPTVVTDDKGDLGNVVIFVKDGLGDYVFTTPTDSVPLAQKGCMYSPHVIAVMAGQTFEVKNDDQTTHNIHPMPKDNREWNKSQAPGTSPIDDSFARPELAIPVKCNVHPWMKSYIFVFKNPYYAITGEGRLLRAEEPASRHLHHRSVAGKIRHSGPDRNHRPQRIQNSRI